MIDTTFQVMYCMVKLSRAGQKILLAVKKRRDIASDTEGIEGE
jgi:hypothetical protein